MRRFCTRIWRVSEPALLNLAKNVVRLANINESRSNAIPPVYCPSTSNLYKAYRLAIPGLETYGRPRSYV